MVNFAKVQFKKSASSSKDFPQDGVKEVAFIGRSNVGKSSLLNMLVNRRSLARVSKTPGRTQLVNFFEVDGQFYLVDLPGYGFAHVPEGMQRSWRKLMTSYLEGRESLAGLVLLLDVRRDPGEEDKQMIEWLRAFEVPVLIVLTKGDKFSRQGCEKRAREIGRLLGIGWEYFIVSSILKKWGCEEIREAILSLVSEESAQS